ncbi:TrbI/VirB10 family protein [Pseudoxanthomonas sp.]|jgi:type IV secretion system protein VirB10|uniref:TrbI/VirB10 family protein n=1 Tax=Pseudoxanthomonas sp. TaxID=1871049 RepID=UPI002E12AB6C|nr:TrbI/VirB10 family protein [Pseudoxanthomonas sp.]
MTTQTPHDHPEEGSERVVPQNPYQRAAPAADPDLDANAPYLRSSDVQRLNRKALMFLAGIVLLLLFVAFWIFRSAVSDGSDEVQTSSRSEQLVIPAAPKDLPELPPEQPAVVAEPELPPLPLVSEYSPTPVPAFPSTPSMERMELTLRERRMMDFAGNARSSTAQTDAVPSVMSPDDYTRLMMQSGGESPAAGTAPADDTTSAKPLYNPNTLLLRGTYIRCVLESRVITDVPGYTSCVVTEPVYSVNGKRLLLPRGSKVMGSYTSDAIIGERAAIVWDRITTPTGMDVNMRSPGTDMLGAAGNPGHYSAHWAQRISSALLISMLSDAFKYAGAKNGPQETAIVNGAIYQNPYESNTARTMERLANMALDRNMARPPTVTINQGTIVNVYVARDVDFSAVMR